MTEVEAGQPGFGSLQGQETCSRPTQPPIQWLTRAVFPEVKRTAREADHLPSSGMEVKKEWSYTFTSPYAFIPLTTSANKPCWSVLQWMLTARLANYIRVGTSLLRPAVDQAWQMTATRMCDDALLCERQLLSPVIPWQARRSPASRAARLHRPRFHERLKVP
jgi:hypothetical protein